MHRSTGKGKSCPANLATGAGTGFSLVTDHIPEFTKRGMCARDPKRALRRRHRHAGAAQALQRRRVQALFAGRRRCPMRSTGGCSARRTTRSLPPTRTAKGISLFDILQPAWAGLYSGAIHPTAEAHAIVADHVVKHVRKAVDRREPAQAAAQQ